VHSGGFSVACAINPDLANRVTLQPIRAMVESRSCLRILLVPQALGADPVVCQLAKAVRPVDGHHARRIPTSCGPSVIFNEDVNPIYQYGAQPTAALPAPKHDVCIGLCRRPWTRGDLYDAGQGTQRSGPAHLLRTAR